MIHFLEGGRLMRMLMWLMLVFVMGWAENPFDPQYRNSHELRSFRNAQDTYEYRYVGLGLADQMHDNERSITNAFTSLSVGSYGPWSRASFQLTHRDTDTIDSEVLATLSYDWLIPIIPDWAYLYAGLLGGYTHAKFDAGYSLNGLHYGGEAGVVLRLFQTLELEGGYRRIYEKADTETSIGGVPLHIALKDFDIVFVHINFLF